MKNLNLLACGLVIAAFAIALSSCVDEPEEPKLTTPTVTTTSITDISKNAAKGGGNVTNDGGSPVTSRGIVWSKTAKPDVSSTTKSSDGNGTGSFTSQLTNLDPGTTYFVRAYAVNEQGTSYGAEVSFTTSESIPPTVTTVEIKDVSFASVTVNGNVLQAGTNAVTERGAVVGTSQNPSLTNTANRKAQSGTGTGTFSVSVTGLTHGTKYYARAYAVSESGTAYGEQKEFTTKSVQSLAIALDGTNDYVQVPHSTSLNLGNTFTLEAWVYLEASGGASQIFMHKWQGTQQYALEMLNGKLHMAVATSSGITTIETTDPLPRGDWVHVAGVRDNGTLRIYVGGLLKATKSIVGNTNSASSGILTFGRRSESSSGFLKGKLDEIRIWNVGRTTSQIDGNKTNNSPQVDPGLVAWYQLNGEAFPNVSNTGITFFEDLTNNNNHGTLENFALTGSTSNWTDSYTRVTTFSIGMKYQGGVIAYVDGTGNHGLIVAASDQSSGAPWGCSGVSISGADGIAIGTGYQNTVDIVAGCASAGIAARLCSDLVLNGYSDWFLPSKDELNRLYVSRTAINSGALSMGGTAFVDDWYWSSTESGSSDAHDLNLVSGNQDIYGKGNSTDNVRAVRNF